MEDVTFSHAVFDKCIMAIGLEVRASLAVSHCFAVVGPY